MKKQEEKTIKEITTKQELVKSNKHNYKLTEEDKQQILLEYYINRSTQNIQQLCSKYNVSVRTIYNIVHDKKIQALANNYITESKKNFNRKLDLIIEKAYNKLNDGLDNQDVSPKDAAVIGAMTLEKKRLIENLSTSNKAISINIKVE